MRPEVSAFIGASCGYVKTTRKHGKHGLKSQGTQSRTTWAHTLFRTNLRAGRNERQEDYFDKVTLASHTHRISNRNTSDH